jgi:hypothetical protein
MIDPKVVLILAAIYGSVWVGHAIVKGAKKIAHGTKTVACAIHVPGIKDCKK